eukprot:GHVN01068635.1.p1 GENE.GHVN01068635.1~~GHVN01068635.1.p1  ORF type:complete len:794 (-),score=149.16 GHVN01068635.1:728-3109(-)
MELIGSVLYTAGVGAGFKWLMFLGSAVAGLGAGGTVVLQRALIGCSLNEISEDNDLAELTHLASGSPEHLASGHPSLSTHSSPSNRSPRSLTSSAGLRPRINALDMTTTGMSIAVVIASVAKMFSKIEPAVLMHLFTSQWMRQIAQDEHPGAAHPPHNHLIHLEGTKRSESGLSGPTISFLSASLISSISHPQTLLESIKERASIYFASMLTYDHMCLTFVLLITILIANVASLYCAVNLKWIAWGGGAPETARALATVSSVTNVAPTPLAIQQRGLPLLLIPNHTTESDTQQRGTPTSLTPWPHHIRFNMAGGLLTPAPSDSGEQTHPLQSSGLASSPRGVISAAMALPGMASLLLVGNTMLRPIFSKVRQLLHYLSLQTHPDSPSASRTQSPRERLSRSFSSPLSLRSVKVCLRKVYQNLIKAIKELKWEFYVLCLLHCLFMSFIHGFLTFSAVIFHVEFRTGFLRSSLFSSIITLTVLIALPLVAVLLDAIEFPSGRGGPSQSQMVIHSESEMSVINTVDANHGPGTGSRQSQCELNTPLIDQFPHTGTNTPIITKGSRKLRSPMKRHLPTSSNKMMALALCCFAALMGFLALTGTLFIASAVEQDEARHAAPPLLSPPSLTPHRASQSPSVQPNSMAAKLWGGEWIGLPPVEHRTQERGEVKRTRIAWAWMVPVMIGLCEGIAPTVLLSRMCQGSCVSKPASLGLAFSIVEITTTLSIAATSWMIGFSSLALHMGGDESPEAFHQSLTCLSILALATFIICLIMLIKAFFDDHKPLVVVGGRRGGLNVS